MSSPKNAVLAASLLLSLATLLLTGCDHGNDSDHAPAGTAGGAPASQAVAAQAPFEVPRLSDADLAALGMALEMKITGAYGMACNGPQNPSKLSTLAAMYYVHGHPEQAATCFRRVVELEPNESAKYFYLGIACQEAGRDAEALSAYEHSLDLGLVYEPQLCRLGDVLTRTDPARAARYYQQALDLNPSDVLAWCGLSRAQTAQGQSEQALRSALIAANLEPNYADAQRAAAQALRDLGRDAQAEQYARLAEVGGAAVPPEDPLAALMLRAGLDVHAACAEAMRISERGEPGGARAILEQVRAMRGGETVAAEALGTVAMSQEQWDEAARLFSEVLENEPQNFTAKSSLGEVLIRQGKLAEAEQCLREVLVQHPDHEPTLRRFADVLKRLKKPREVLAVMEAAVAARPFDPSRHTLLSRFYASAGQTQDALGELRKAVELQPDYFPAHQQLGVMLCAQRKYAEAKTEFERALQTNPRFEDAYAYLSTVLIQADKDRRGGERVLRESLKNLPNSHLLANSLAWVLATAPDAAQRKPEEAVQLAERASAMTGNERHKYLDTLAAAYAEAGRFDDATRLSRQAIEAARRDSAPEVEQYRARLALYEQKQPFHEPG
jgi:tetratricopeptide (TPR) repeat protein